MHFVWCYLNNAVARNVKKSVMISAFCIAFKTAFYNKLNLLQMVDFTLNLSATLTTSEYEVENATIYYGLSWIMHIHQQFRLQSCLCN